MSMNETLSCQMIHVSSNWTAYAPLEPEDDLLSTSQMHSAADVISIGPQPVFGGSFDAGHALPLRRRNVETPGIDDDRR